MGWGYPPSIPIRRPDDSLSPRYWSCIATFRQPRRILAHPEAILSRSYSHATAPQEGSYRQPTGFLQSPIATPSPADPDVMGASQPPCSQRTSRKQPSLRPRPAGALRGIAGWPGEIAPLSNSHHIQDWGGVTLRAPPFVAQTTPYLHGTGAASLPFASREES